jgi:gentisate 1,2-dioxygenase
MQRGDVISTPQWQYHDHGKDGSGPMIWLDGLDLPQFQHFPVHFVEHYSQPRYPAIDTEGESPLVWPWVEMKARLDAVPGEWARREYRRENGEPVSKVIGCSAERVAGRAPERQETASSVYHVILGSGTVTIAGQKMEVKEGDTFCIPSWKVYGVEGEMYLYRFDDRPMLDKLGFYRNRDVLVHPYDQ